MDEDEEVPQEVPQEEAPHEEQAQPQATEEEPILLYLHTGREVQGHVLLKDRVFNHTKHFDFDLLESTGMNIDFANVWHAIGWDAFVPISDIIHSPSNSYAPCNTMMMVFPSISLGKSTHVLGKT